MPHSHIHTLDTISLPQVSKGKHQIHIPDHQDLRAWINYTETDSPAMLKRYFIKQNPHMQLQFVKGKAQEALSIHFIQEGNSRETVGFEVWLEPFRVKIDQLTDEFTVPSRKVFLSPELQESAFALNTSKPFTKYPVFFFPTNSDLPEGITYTLHIKSLTNTNGYILVQKLKEGRDEKVYQSIQKVITND